MVEDKAPDDPGEFAIAVNKLCDYLAGNRTRKFRGNAAPEVRRVAFGLMLFRDLLDNYRKSLTIADISATGIREAYAILDHLKTGRQHPISKHIVGIHSDRFRPQRAPAGGIEIEGRKVVVGVARAYALVAGITPNRARTEVANAARAGGIRFTNGMIRQWDDRFRRPDGIAEDLAKADPGPEAWADLLLKISSDDPRDVLQNGMKLIACWWMVAKLPGAPT
jgi:hypothetical protein